MFQYLNRHQELKPDLVIFQGGENDKFDQYFRTTYESILKSFPRMVVLGDWNSDEKSEFDREESARFGFPFVDLRSIHRIPANSGDSGPHKIKGVAIHPNDAGMMAISNAVIRAIALQPQ